MSTDGKTVTVSLLNLISTPVPVLNSLGLDTAVGLSSDDPIGERRSSEAYRAYLSVYRPDGVLVDRLLLGDIPPRRRRRFDVSGLTRRWFPGQDHLTVVHRIPVRLLAGGQGPEALVEIDSRDAEFGMYRSLIEYSLVGQAHGSVIYETPPGLNMRRPGRPPSTTLTFTSKVVVSPVVNTYLIVTNYSMDPRYDTVVSMAFTFLAPSGERVATGVRPIRPFTFSIIDVRATIPAEVIESVRPTAEDPACFGYVGYSHEGSLIPLVVTLATEPGAVAVEHTHPAQAYTVPGRPEDKNRLKSRALDVWKSILGEVER